MDDRAEMARVMTSLLALTESLLNGVKYEGADGEKARELVKKIKATLARSSAIHARHIAAHRISCDTIRHLEAEIVRLQAHLKDVRTEIEQSWQRVQTALSSGQRERQENERE